jgi:serine/threonine protein kinase
MSIVVKDLISKILKFNPEERISIAEIRKHSFCTPFQPIIRGLMPS